MPFDVTFAADGAAVITRYRGVLITSDIQAAYEERFTDVNKIRKFRLLWSDYCAVVETRISDVDVRELAAQYARSSAFNPNVVAVAVMPRDLLFGLGRMWQVFVEETPWKTLIARTRDEADDFVRGHLAEADRLLPQVRRLAVPA